ncbi:sugar phosphate isomerase/epimerase [Parabacteroides sp. PFB2-12]|uniref:sugar phosphate isomerase/epimerase family protein n=1 Tax=unclassified Parabacteroides TaxID=2649774 RepID=UPI0024730AB0|nr:MULTISPECIES: sugar phosphate isomerase/epimerase family protein [unclassified Parabacteroides]MDH6341994.1 sugar phosphate isomerase/epimerase [Parabacteroides sp. PM6-13]MDH6389692.1 sugar phosphate isomerase/epimerase [Parabacteroides sp. PFB2-12]
MQNRRDFLKQASLLLAGGIVAPKLLSSCAAGTPGKHMGLQLYSLREMVKDAGIQPVIEAVAKMGYTHVETANYSDGKVYGLAPAEFKKLCDDNGLKCTSAHLGQSFSKEKEAEVMAWWDKAIETYDQIGVKYMVQPSMPVNNETTLDDIKMYCDYFSAVGYKTAAASIAFGYHNHSFEFRKIDDQLIYDYMLNNVSKNHCFFQLDVYWCQQGGYDPVEYLKKHADQFKNIHIKDAKEIGASGQMNFEAIFNQMKANNVKDWYVEVEQYTNNNPVESVQQSYDFLKEAKYVY